jgi:hypothetical protein
MRYEGVDSWTVEGQFLQVQQGAARVLANDENTGSQPHSSFGVANESTVDPSITTSADRKE